MLSIQSYPEYSRKAKINSLFSCQLTYSFWNLSLMLNVQASFLCLPNLYLWNTLIKFYIVYVPITKNFNKGDFTSHYMSYILTSLKAQTSNEWWAAVNIFNCKRILHTLCSLVSLNFLNVYFLCFTMLSQFLC